MDKYTEQELIALRKKNNPDNKPTGHYTSRCGVCGSNDLWDDATAYGCNCCETTFFTGDLPPLIIKSNN